MLDQLCLPSCTEHVSLANQRGPQGQVFAVSQLIFEGKTDAHRPNRDGVSDQVLFSHIESHWHAVSSLEDFMLFLDWRLNPAESEERKDWIFVLDLASIHRLEEFRTKVPNHIHDGLKRHRIASLAIWQYSRLGNPWWQMRPFESLAETIMTGQNITTAFDFSLKHLKRRGLSHGQSRRRSPFRADLTSRNQHGKMQVGSRMKISRCRWHRRRRSTMPVNSSSPTQTNPLPDRSMSKMSRPSSIWTKRRGGNTPHSEGD